MPVTSLRSLLRRGTLFTAAIALVALVAACSAPAATVGDGDTGGNSGGNTGGGTVAVTDGALELSAAGLAFDATVIEAPAGETFTITFTNNDTAPHNIAIYTEEGGEEIAKGAVIDGGATTEVQVGALDVGEYYFVCDIHPEMSGSLVVAEG